MELNLGWSQGYDALKYHGDDAYEEKGMSETNASSRPPIAIFSHKYFNELARLDHNKIHDYCFIGSIESDDENRRWVIDFAKQHFTSKSVFLATDAAFKHWDILGDYDVSYSHKDKGFQPKRQIEPHVRKAQFRVVEENLFYFQTMCQSKYVLCPAGDSTWSFRFYETIMCRSLPVVDSWHHTYRTAEEAVIPYQYVLRDNIDGVKDIDYDDLVNKNTDIFKQYHLL